VGSFLLQDMVCFLYTRDQDSGPGEIDLHGLFVKEAIDYTDKAIEAAKRRGDTTIKIIVGPSCSFSNRWVFSLTAVAFVSRQRLTLQRWGCQAEARC
jgi:hypothetical protein